MKALDVNWYQKEIDSPERNWEFRKKQGNLIKFLYNRYQWYNNPRLSRVKEFPLHVDIEVSSICDLTCPMCPRRHTDLAEYGHMDFNLFKKIVDECATYNLFSARLSWRGEVLTHPRFIDFARYIKVERNIPNVSFLTNGHNLSDEIAAELVNIGIDYISISVDGVGEIYNKIRAPLKFEDVYNAISNLKRIRDDKGKKKPQIRVNGLWPAIAQNPKLYFEKMAKIVDKIVSNPVKDYRVTKKTKFLKDYICQFPWQRLFVGSDGRVQPCSVGMERLYIGDVKKQTLSEIWKGREIEKVRNAHLEGRSDEYYACSRCSYKVDVNFNEQFKKDWKNWDPSILAEQEKE